MAMQSTSLWLPERQLLTMVSVFANSTALTATGHKCAFIGRVWNKDRASKNITKVGFRFGAITKAGGSGLTVSLQDVSLTAGPPYQPDGTPDQTVAIANGNAGFAASAWMQTAALSATRAVNYGDLLAVVIEYDGAGRLGSDSVVVTTISDQNADASLESGLVSFTAAWAIIASTGLNGVILEFDDGTFGTLSQGFPASATSNDAFNSGSNPEVIGLEFQVPFNCRCDGAWFAGQAAAGADFQISLYDGNSVLVTNTFDSNAFRASATNFFTETVWPEQTLLANHTYRIGLAPTTANNVTLYNWSVSAAGHLQAFPGGTAFQYNTAHAGTWGSPTATKRPAIGLRLSAVDDGAGGAHIIGG